MAVWGWSVMTDEFYRTTRDLVLAHTKGGAGVPGYSSIADRLTSMAMFHAARVVVFRFDHEQRVIVTDVDYQKRWLLTSFGSSEKYREGIPVVGPTSPDLAAYRMGRGVFDYFWKDILEVASAPYFIDYKIDAVLNIEARISQDLEDLMEDIIRDRKRAKEEAEEEERYEELDDDDAANDAATMGVKPGDKSVAADGTERDAGGPRPIRPHVTNYEMFRIMVQGAAVSAFDLFVFEIGLLDMEEELVQHAGSEGRAGRFKEVLKNLKPSILTDLEEATNEMMVSRKIKGMDRTDDKDAEMDE